MTLSIYRPEDEAILGLLEAYERTQPDSPERADADTAIALYIASQTAVQRVDRACSVLAGVEGQLAAADTQIMTLLEIRERLKRAFANYERQIVKGMTDFGITDLRGSVRTLHISTNPEAVLFTNEALVPDEYRDLHITMPHARWTEIKQLLIDGGNQQMLDEVHVGRSEPKKSWIKPILKADGGVPGAYLDRAKKLVRR